MEQRINLQHNQDLIHYESLLLYYGYGMLRTYESIRKPAHDCHSDKDSQDDTHGKVDRYVVVTYGVVVYDA